MKKFLSVVLAVLMLFSCLTAAAYAADEKQYAQLCSSTDVPIVVVRGDGENIFDENGERAYTPTDIFSMFGSMGDDDEGKENLKQSVMNVLYPFIIQGIMFNDWEPYYNALETEIAELFEKSILDENGNPRYGTGISQDRKNTNEWNKHYNRKNGNGTFNYGNEYRFFYDWRLDPIEVAADLKEFIDSIKKTTGCDKVCILGNCLGTVIATTYVAMYGMDDIKGIGLEAGVYNGAAFISEAISGKFKVDVNAISRMLVDLETMDSFSFGENQDIIMSTIDLLDKSGVFEQVKGVSKELIYYKLVEGVTSSLALSTSFTYPGYWACVSSEDYEAAKDYVFGKEGSEKRVKYAGLIAKLDNYNVTVRQNMDKILKQIDEEGNLAIEVRYGIQHIPISESCNEIGDEMVLLKDGSYGATTADVYGTLDGAYIAKQEEAGLGKYISPDKKVDASTCIAPDSTWFIKGLSHNKWPDLPRRLLTTVIASNDNLTVDDFEYSQFIIYNMKNNTMAKMTEYNCNTEFWNANPNYDKPTNPYVKLVNFLKSLFDWFRTLLGKIFK